MITIELNEREAQALLAFIDVAVKTLGVRGAADAVLLVHKLEEAMKAKADKPELKAVS